MSEKKCINCGKKSLTKFFDLGHQPNGNRFITKEEFDEEKYFPFAMLVCENCWQVQLAEFPSMEFLFGSHPYISGLNVPVVKHFQKLTVDVLEKFPIQPGSLVLDIGANDGTLLKNFLDSGMRVIGIDPNDNTEKMARHKGITICKNFWNLDTAKAIKSLNIKPDLITATAVFYHVDDLHSFVAGLAEVLEGDAIFMTQCIYLKDILEKFQFDHFYHEHTMIHAISPLKPLFEQYGLRLIDIDFYEIHGGSFVLYVAKNSSTHKTSTKINEAIEYEYKFGLTKINTYYEFSKIVLENSDKLRKLIKSIVANGKSIYALGAPLKGSTLLNFCSLGKDFISKAVEINEQKIGKFIPGVHIPVVSESNTDSPPDYYLVLTWNFLDYFLEKYSDYLKNGGKFIIPHPVVKVIGYEDITT